MNSSGLLWVGWILTLLTWFVALKISIGSTKRTEINKSIDLFQSMVRDLEDIALKFWMGEDTNTHEYQLTLKLRRVSTAANNIIKIDRVRVFPSKEMSEFRKAITLNIEEASEGKRPSKSRMQKIMIWSVRLQDYFEKVA